MTLQVLCKGEGFRTKVRQALDVWATRHPEEVLQFRDDCRSMRSRKLDPKGYFIKDDGSRDTDNAVIAITPPFVELILAMTEWKTKFLFGSPCGTGERLWYLDPANTKILKEELACGVLSDMRV